MPVVVVNKADRPLLRQRVNQALEVLLAQAEFGGVVHSFTDPQANMPGRAQYNPRTARRAFKMMDDFFGELFSG